MKDQHYVKFFFPGSFFSEEESKKVDSWEINGLELPPYAFAFQFYTIRTQKSTLEDGRTKEFSEQIDESSVYYPNGVVYTADEIKDEFGDDSILYSNVIINNKKAIRTQQGNFQFFDPKKHKICYANSLGVCREV
jgi:hypothetical protein